MEESRAAVIKRVAQAIFRNHGAAADAHADDGEETTSHSPLPLDDDDAQPCGEAFLLPRAGARAVRTAGRIITLRTQSLISQLDLDSLDSLVRSSS